ncbi:glutamine synthetase [Ruegeria sp. 2012CJ41-6]|uniref:Glutamine synthetase n=1 Tax=Ruegeria spongiae TaxID=2942209 RepID=A0ABT0Q7N3_9RHOB|nr:glutamine synthetase [Ruegeria spongiae]MCL6285825.1 glutamine synthetase [Ruegeria spongiae]
MTGQKLNLKTIEDVRNYVSEKDPKHVKVGFFDMDGVFRGKFMAKEKFLSALDDGYGFCDAVLGWDVADTLYDNSKFTGWHTGFPDANLRIIPESGMILPFDNETVFFSSEFAGRAEAICPRAVLRRVLQRAKDMGFVVNAAMEFEFFIFQETPDSLEEKGFKNLQTLTPGNFSYSALRSIVQEDLYQDILDTFDSIGIELEGLHAETGPGVVETAIAVDDALSMSDKASIFKAFMKILAQKRGLMATFMAKWNQQLSGQSGHTHMSLWSIEGVPLFVDPAGKYQMSQTMRHFLGGQLAHLREFAAMIAPNINSYARLTPGHWAPTSATWGVDNRTVGIRVIQGSEKSQRLEYRIPGSDVNPYLSMAAAIGSGLLGIEREIDPGAASIGNAYDQPVPIDRQLPTNLESAGILFAGSEAAKDLFGAAFVEHFAASRIFEAQEFGRAVTDWELKRYFEVL